MSDIDMMHLSEIEKIDEIERNRKEQNEVTNG